MIRASRPTALAALAILLASPAAAHEFWLSPSRYQAQRGDTVTVGAWAGTGFRGEAKPFARARVVRLALRGPRDLDIAGAAVNGDLTFARFLPADAGGALVAYESNFATIELPAAEFDAYLALEGLDGARRERARRGPAAGPGRERYARCPKTWIGGGDLARLTRPVGLALELVPLDDPGTAPRLRVRVLYRGRPLAGALVKAWCRPAGADGAPVDPGTRDSVAVCAAERSGQDGVATLTLDRPGEWLLSAVHMVPSEVRAEADWQSVWASLTFLRPAVGR
jgi:uncharacterized GH25 family protein